ncbi:MAG: glycosyltransferase [Bacteroidetes bacterium]|nr:glycosyltransferase [Bacteroidota bacterium]
MQTKAPKITVLMPAYNAGKYIREAINSVLAQTYRDFELLIINDGSMDDTAGIVLSYYDPRIVLVNKEHAGIAAALNTGLRLAEAPYIARFDADDICLPNRLETQLNFLKDHPEYVLVGSDAEYILENGEFLFGFKCIAHSDEEVQKNLHVYCPFIHSSVMYKRDEVINAGGYNVHAHNFEDYLLWINLSKAGKMQNLREPMIKVRFNPASATIDEKWRGERFRQLKKQATLRGSITVEEGNELLEIIKKQNVHKIKHGAYHALCGKKFLANNYQPKKARSHVRKAIGIRPLRLDNYLLYAVSFLPENTITWLYKLGRDRLTIQ